MARTLALDLGTVRTGAAISDELGITAQPAGSWSRKGYKDDLRNVIRLIEEYETVESVVVGIPRNMDGSYGEMATLCGNIAKKLEKDLDIPVATWDERLTTAMAERVLIEANVSRKKRKNFKDQMAAQLILSSWLQSRPAT